MTVTDNGAEAPATPGLSIEDILEAKRPETEEVTVVLDPERDLKVTFRFEAIGREAWEKLIDDHGPTEEQDAKHKEQQTKAGVMPAMLSSLPWNVDTFQPAALAATCVEPKMTQKQAHKLLHDRRWNSFELDRIWSAVLLVNQRSRRVSLGKEYEALLASLLNSPPLTTT